MDCSHSSWLLRFASPLLLLVACDPSTADPGSGESGSEESGAEDLSCEGGDSPPPCVGLDTEGCLNEPAGQAVCSSGAWTCEEPFTAPQVDPEAVCAIPSTGDCEGANPMCDDQSLSGECSDYVISAYAFCVEGEWTCPPGFHDEGESHCEWGESEGGG